MRIVSGLWRGSTIFVPDTTDTRPTMDRTRQAVFNILRSAQWALDQQGIPLLHDAAVLDVFAGSGAMGFEAVSQGAAQAVFFEQNPVAVQAIEKNRIKLRGALDKTRLVKGDVLRAPVCDGTAAALAFFDPPYDQGLLAPALAHLLARGWISRATLLVLEMQKNEQPALQDGLVPEMFDARIYGTSKIMFARLKS